MDVTAYLESLAQTAGLADEDKAALKKVLSNQKFAEEVGKGIKRQDEFSRGMDDIRTQAQKLEADKKSWTDWYQNAVARDAEREEELQRLKAGTTTASTTTATTSAANGGLTKKELEEAQGRMVQIIKQMGRVSSRHAAQFHEELDVDAVEKIALEKGLTVDKAYEEYVAPRVKELQEQSFAEKLKAAREEGLREGLSKRDVPDEGSKSFHPLFGHSKAVEVSGKLTDAQRADRFAEAFRTAAETAKK